MLKITGVSKYKGSTYMIEFEEGETAFLNYEVVSAYGLRAGLDMPQSAWEKIVFDNEFRKAKEGLCISLITGTIPMWSFTRSWRRITARRYATL